MALLLLHLSDIHIKGMDDQILNRAEDIAASMFSHLQEASEVVIAITGDISFSGKGYEFDCAETFLNQIKAGIQTEKNIPVSFVLCPGNHDCDFALDNSVRKHLLRTMNQDLADTVDAALIDQLTAVQAPYFKFRDKLQSCNKSTYFDDKLWTESVFEFEEKKVLFNSLNVAWISQIHESPSSICFPISRYQERTPADISISLLHHPLNWFDQNAYRSFRGLLRSSSDLILSGHEHIGNASQIEDTESGGYIYIEGAALQEGGLKNSAFNIIKIDLSNEKFWALKYKWDGDRYLPVDKESWKDWRSFPNSVSNEFAIRPEFQKTLEDPGAFFKHPNAKTVCLTDIFVFPDLKNLSSSSQANREFTNSSNLIKDWNTLDNILLEGDDKSGKTSLLYQIFKSSHDQGLVPLYISNKHFTKDSETSIRRAINKAISEQYGKQSVEAFNQLTHDRKLLLLDDFDDGPIKNESSKASLLNNLNLIFGRMIITAGEMFEMRELIENADTESLPEMTHFEVQPFGYQLRSKLIEKWFGLGNQLEVTKAEFIGQCDKAERLMDTVMTKMIIPPAPLYLLTLLQSLNAGMSSDFQNTSLSEYYRFLLATAFQHVGVPPEQLSEYFHYSTQLAWFFHTHTNGKTELSEDELKKFNNKFSDEWHTVPYEARIQQLTKARVLIKSGEDFSFHYPYIYYFLKGKYISENLVRSNVIEHIKHCCEHLYVRDYANTVLFVAHHTNDTFILDCINNSYKKLFRKDTPITFDQDTADLNAFIEGVPELEFISKSVEEHRKDKHEINDKLASNGTDGLAEKEEENDRLSIMAQLTMLFKSGEILGQVLKNQYSNIQRVKKRQYLEDLFNGPLRALSNFYKYIEESPDMLVNQIEKEFVNRNKTLNTYEKHTIAQEIATRVIEFLSFSFIIKAAQSASAESLLENVTEVLQHNDTNALRLIELAILLDSPKPIPRKKLTDFMSRTKDELLPFRILKLLIYNRLYMFKTSESDMQWLQGSRLKVDLEKQHAITYIKHKRG